MLRAGLVVKPRPDERAVQRLFRRAAESQADGPSTSRSIPASALRYAAIWYEGRQHAWVQLRDMIGDHLSGGGGRAGRRRLPDDRFRVVLSERIGAALRGDLGCGPGGRGFVIRSGLTRGRTSQTSSHNADLGLRLVDFERYNSASGARYAGIWVENNPARHDYSRQGRAGRHLQAYRSARPEMIPDIIPGISVAAILNGRLIYRRGFGFADINDGKVAHGETVYNAASVSKVIGGTLAAKLEAEDGLADGTAIPGPLVGPTAWIHAADGGFPRTFRSSSARPTSHRTTRIGSSICSRISAVWATLPRMRFLPILLHHARNQTTPRTSATSAGAEYWRTELVTVGVRRRSEFHGRAHLRRRRTRARDRPHHPAARPRGARRAVRPLVDAGAVRYDHSPGELRSRAAPYADNG